MKDKIQKLASALATAVTLLKEEKVSEATDALVEAAAGIAELDTAATEAQAEIEKSKTELATATEAVQKSEEEIKKWASFNVSAESMKALLDDMWALKTMLADNVGIMKSVSTKEDIEAIGARLNVIEKARDEKQLKDEKREEVKKFAGLDLTPGTK